MLQKIKILLAASWLLLSLLAYAYYGAFILKQNSTPDYLYKSDYSVFYRSTQLYFAGQNIYEPSTDRVTTKKLTYDLVNPNGNLNPPLLTLLMLWLGKFKFMVSFGIWLALSLLAGISGVYLLQRSQGTKQLTDPATLSITAAFLSYFPFFLNIKTGQLGLFLLPALVLIWTGARRGQDRLPGILLGLLIGIKLFLGLFLLFFLIQKRWRLLGWAIATLILGFLVTFLVFGKAAYLSYYATLQQAVWYVPNWNASVYGYLYRLVGVLGKGTAPAQLIHLVKLIYYAISGITVALLAWLAWPRNNTNKLVAYFDIGFAFTLGGCLFLSPLGWNYYFPALLIVIYIVLSLIKQLPFKRIFYLLAWSSIMLSAFPMHLIKHPESLSKIRNLFWASSNFYALTLLMLVIIGLQVMLTRNALENNTTQTSKYFCRFTYAILFILAIFPANIVGSCLAKLIYGN